MEDWGSTGTAVNNSVKANEDWGSTGAAVGNTTHPSAPAQNHGMRFNPPPVDSSNVPVWTPPAKGLSPQQANAEALAIEDAPKGATTTGIQERPGDVFGAMLGGGAMIPKMAFSKFGAVAAGVNEVGNLLGRWMGGKTLVSKQDLIDDVTSAVPMMITPVGSLGTLPEGAGFLQKAGLVIPKILNKTPEILGLAGEVGTAQGINAALKGDQNPLGAGGKAAKQMAGLDVGMRLFGGTMGTMASPLLQTPYVQNVIKQVNEADTTRKVIDKLITTQKEISDKIDTYKQGVGEYFGFNKVKQELEDLQPQAKQMVVGNKTQEYNGFMSDTDKLLHTVMEDTNGVNADAKQALIDSVGKKQVAALTDYENSINDKYNTVLQRGDVPKTDMNITPFVSELTTLQSSAPGTIADSSLNSLLNRYKASSIVSIENAHNFQKDLAQLQGAYVHGAASGVAQQVGVIRKNLVAKIDNEANGYKDVSDQYAHLKGDLEPNFARAFGQLTDFAGRVQPAKIETGLRNMFETNTPISTEHWNDLFNPSMQTGALVETLEKNNMPEVATDIRDSVSNARAVVKQGNDNIENITNMFNQKKDLATNEYKDFKDNAKDATFVNDQLNKMVIQGSQQAKNLQEQISVKQDYIDKLTKQSEGYGIQSNENKAQLATEQHKLEVLKQQGYDWQDFINKLGQGRKTALIASTLGGASGGIIHHPLLMATVGAIDLALLGSAKANPVPFALKFANDISKGIKSDVADKFANTLNSAAPVYKQSIFNLLHSLNQQQGGK